MGMRPIISTMQVSLDGMAERTDGRTDFIGTESGTFDWDLFDQADACVLGRVMYPEYEQYWRALPEGATVDEIRYAEFANKTPHYVLSRTVSELDWPVARVISDLDAIRTLRNGSGGVVQVVGGPSTVSAFIEHDLLDELRLTVHPVILGGGMALLGNVTHEHRFDLAASIPLAEGRIRLVYRRAQVISS
jgi:dihydrofolate reductase